MTDAQNTPQTGPNFANTGAEGTDTENTGTESTGTESTGTESTEGTANTATSNDPLTDFSIPQDADIVADDAAGDPESHDSGAGSTENNATGNDSESPATGDDAITDEPSDQASQVAENPAVDAATPAEAEELTPEPGS